ncbi:adenylate/guanylate cyclase domain-containing protein [Ruegeria pomeroyi]|nr:adenylate/guanylate cyclase domain-containing protein [Ruegeria pomeroyi]
MDRRLTTILAADLSGYSRLMAADEEGTVTRLRHLFDHIIRPGLSREGGRLIKTMGDGMLVEFASPVAALRSAVAILQRVARDQAENAPDTRMLFRVGIHLGDVISDGDDILGDAVNIAARLESLATPGGICISRSVHDQVRGKVAAELIALGPQPVKNLPDPVEVWRVGAEGIACAADKPLVRTELPAVVILPFDNMSADPEQDFLADGIVEDVTTELSRFRTLTVIARNSAFAYKGSHKDVRQIAEELGVRYVVEGSVRRAGDRLRATAQLIDARTGAHVWAERWDRTMADLFDLQDELTAAIVSGVEPELGAHERNLARRKPTDSLTAWEMCQKGYSEFTRYTDEGYSQAHAFYTRAIAADPDFALPHALLARLAWVKVITGRSRDPAAEISTGLDHAAQAIERDDRLEIGYVALGVLLAITGREQDAADALDKAEALNPNNAVLHFGRCHACLFMQRLDCDRLERAARTALRLNPKDPMAWGFWFQLGNAFTFRNTDAADPEALAAYETACRFPNADYFVFMATALKHAKLGNRDKAAHYLAQARERYPALTAEFWRSAFRFPIWARWVAADEANLQILIDLGLPPE